jgi:hemolysin D
MGKYGKVRVTEAATNAEVTGFLQPRLYVPIALSQFSRQDLALRQNSLQRAYNLRTVVVKNTKTLSSVPPPAHPATAIDNTATIKILAPAPAVTSRLTWSKVALFTIVVILVSGGSYYFRQQLQTTFSPVSLTQQTTKLINTQFTGTIKPLREIKLAAPTTIIVQQVLVNPGSNVQPGQPLLAFDAPEAKAALQQAKAEKDLAEQQVTQLTERLKQAENRLIDLRQAATNAQSQVALAQRRAESVPLRQRQDSPERAQAVYEQALSRYQRAEGLHQQGLIATQEFEETRTLLRIAEIDLQNAREAARMAAALTAAQEKQGDLQVALSTDEQKQQILDLQNQLQQARLRQQTAIQQLTVAEKRWAATTLTATVPGVVVEIPAKVGDQVIMGTMLVKIAQLEQMVIEVSVSASMINVLQVGQPAQITLPLASQPLIGTISTINPLPQTNLTHIVEITFANPQGWLLAGQPAGVRFLPTNKLAN